MAEWRYGQSITIENPGSLTRGQIVSGVAYFFHARESRIYEYNISANTWSSSKTIPVSISTSSFDSITDGTYIYIFSGYDPTTVFRYTPLNNAWQQLSQSSRPYYPTPGYGAISYENGRVHLIGGDDNGASSNDHTIYNISSNTWSSGAAIPEKKESFSSITLDGKIYCIGGESYVDPYDHETVKSVNVYSVSTASWSSAADLNVERRRVNATTDGTYIYALGGFSYQQQSYFQSMEIYNPMADTWTYGTPVPESIENAFGAVYFDNKLISFNGLSGVYNQVSVFILDVAFVPTIEITNPEPAGGFQNEQEPITLSWVLNASDGSTQRSAVVQWRNTTSPNTINSINVNNSTQSVTVPANTFPNGSFQWRVMATTTTGYPSEYTEWFTISTIDEQPFAPTNLIPRTGSRPGINVITFSWRHNSPNDTPQRAYEIQITYNDAGSYSILVPKTLTSSQIYNAPANSIKPVDPTGKIGWRIRTYNSDDVASPWSDTVYFIVESPPATPVWVSVTPRINYPIEARWTSSVQTSFELQVLSGQTVAYDSGLIASQTPRHTLNKPIKDGSYVFRVKIYNNRGWESAWSVYSAAVSTKKPYSIKLTGLNVKNGAKLTWETEV